MTTKLEGLLERIDPNRTYDDVAIRVDRAFNSYSMPKGKISSCEQYDNILANFFGHVMSVVFSIDTGGLNDRKFLLPQCLYLLEKAFNPNAYHTTYVIAESGAEGGIYRILKKIADLMAEQYAQNRINYEIHEYWNNLSVNEKLSAMDEYLDKYGHFLPKEMTKGNAPRIKAFFINILEEHPKLIRKLRTIGR